MRTIFWLENLKGTDHSEDLGVDGKIGWEGVDWMHLGQGKDQWRAVVNKVKNFHVP
jgi:hypothetical protein